MKGISAVAAIAAAGLMAVGMAVGGPAFAADKFTFKTTDVKEVIGFTNDQVYNGFGCAGKNISPELEWSGAPAQGKSFAITVYDPDAPTGSGFWHWVVFNIPPNTKKLSRGAGDPKQNKMPAGAVQSRTDFGTPGWGGPCPPAGDKAHRYIFTLYVVDVDKLDADAATTAAVVGFNLHFHTIQKVSFTVPYGRQ
jgi:hypothetical protein